MERLAHITSHHVTNLFPAMSISWYSKKNSTLLKNIAFFFFGVLFLTTLNNTEHEITQLTAQLYHLSFLPPGGRDKRGGPVLTFPSRTNHDRIRQEDLRRLIAYLAGIPRYSLFNPQKSHVFMKLVMKQLLLHPHSQHCSNTFSE